MRILFILSLNIIYVCIHVAEKQILCHKTSDTCRIGEDRLNGLYTLRSKILFLSIYVEIKTNLIKSHFSRNYKRNIKINGQKACKHPVI
jgi:hypothetical protein